MVLLCQKILQLTEEFEAEHLKKTLTVNLKAKQNEPFRKANQEQNF